MKKAIKHITTTLKPLKKYGVLLTILSCLFVIALFLFITNKPYPLISNYYLQDNIALSIQYHHDFWDGDTSDFKTLLDTDKSPKDYILSTVLQEYNTDNFLDNFGMLVVENNKQYIPLYFFEINSSVIPVLTEYKTITYDKWLIASKDLDALQKVKNYNNTIETPNISLFSHPNILIFMDWTHLVKTNYLDIFFTRYFNVDTSTNYFQSIKTYLRAIVTITSISGNIHNGALDLSGYSNTAADFLLPVHEKNNSVHFTLPISKNTTVISLYDPVQSLASFSDKLQEIHHMYGLTLRNYITEFTIKESQTLRLVKRMSMEINKDVLSSKLLVWTDKNTDWKQLVQEMFASNAVEREYTLPDGTKGAEYVISDTPIEYSTDSFKVNDTTYYFSITPSNTDTLFALGLNPLESTPEYFIESSQDDVLHWYVPLFDSVYNIDLSTVNSADTLIHTIHIHK